MFGNKCEKKFEEVLERVNKIEEDMYKMKNMSEFYEIEGSYVFDIAYSYRGWEGYRYVLYKKGSHTEVYTSKSFKYIVSYARGYINANVKKKAKKNVKKK